MERLLFILTLLGGAYFTVQVGIWVFDPATAAAGLGMALLDSGIGLNTQIGDMTAFFGFLAVTMVVGALQKNPNILLFPAVLLGFAALFRTLSSQLHEGSEFVPEFVVGEVIIALILLAYRRRLMN
jgi:hypothetical protein